MAKIRFKKINTRNPLLFSTSVENLFISELLPAAPGEYVKVYLFGLMNAGFGGAEDIKVTSNVLNMPVEDIEKAWAYWEDKGAVQQVYDPETRSYRIDFIRYSDRRWKRRSRERRHRYLRKQRRRSHRMQESARRRSNSWRKR